MSDFLPTTRRRMHQCPGCEAVLDDFTGVTPDSLPTEGAVSVCLYCAHVAIFTGDSLKTRSLTLEEMEEIADNPYLRKALSVVNSWRKRGD